VGTAVVKTKWFHFRQNNSGGSFDVNDEKGIGPHVYIEAIDADHANVRAEALGIYFDGVDQGNDCECCGDRWNSVSDNKWDSTDELMITDNYAFIWHDTVYAHKLDGTIGRLTRDEWQQTQSPVISTRMSK
jgi:hypothetical protein